MEVSKKFSSANKTLFPDDSVTVTIQIKNTSGNTQKNVKYLDSIPNIFTTDDTKKYSVEINGQNRVEKDFVEKNSSDYAREFSIGEIPAGATATIRYTLKVLPASYGEMLVGDYEKGIAGQEDNFGDIAFKTSTTCGADMMTWLSTEARKYNSSRRPATFSGVPLPDGVSQKLQDSDKNGVIDSAESISPEQGKKEFASITGKDSDSKKLVTVTKE